MSTVLNHVLIVDPDEAVRADVRRLLLQAKVKTALISEASTAEDAYQAYQAPGEQRPAVIFFALNLCGERGDEWLNLVRGKGRALNIPVILLGQDDDDERIDVALAAGAYQSLPISELTARRLIRTLETALSRHQMVQQLSESEANYRNLVEASPTLKWVADTTKQRVYFNTSWLNFTGRTLEQERGFGWLESIHPEDRARVLEIYTQSFDRREPFEVEYRLLRFDGEYRWIVARGQPRYADDGTFSGYLGNCLDMTERKEIENALRLNEERLRVVLQGSPITVMTVDRDLRYTWVHNAQGGLDADAMIGKRDEELFPENVARVYSDFKREVLEREIPLRRELSFTWHGNYERYDSRAEPLRDVEGNVIGLTIVAINITDRVRTEERAHFLAEASHLLSSSLDYETTLEQLTFSLVPRLADWCSIDILENTKEIVQVAVAHVDPAKVDWARNLRKHNPPSIDDPAGLARVLRTGESEFLPVIPQEMIDEAIRNAETEEQREAIRSVGFRSFIIVPLKTRQRILGAITLVWSESNRHYDEADLAFVEELALRAATAVDHARLYQESLVRAEEFRVLSETLELQVDERTKELRRSNQDLDQFAYIASHDLKAPLRAIDHLSTWLLEDVGHLLPDRSHEHLEKMRSRIKRMEGLLDDLLTYSRAGRFRGEAALVDMSEVVARVIETVSPPEGFTVHVDGELPMLYTYSAPLETVLRNLVNNAIKHHDQPNGTIRISARAMDEMVEFAVSDDGPGIDPAFHDRIFQMFQTLRPRDQVEGSGMGLAVVDKIVTSVGGTVKLESSAGKGATFRFTWPLEYKPQ